jgi:hypothetical protein
MIISTKSPPILNLERKKDKIIYNNNDDNKFYKKILNLKYKSQ